MSDDAFLKEQDHPENQGARHANPGKTGARATLTEIRASEIPVPGLDGRFPHAAPVPWRHVSICQLR
jgi:hypothetical protein